MNLNETTSEKAAGPPAILKRCWRAFNRWRKRYLPLRLFFLLVFAVHVCLEYVWPIIPRLVRTAVYAMEAGSEPRLINATARFRRVRLAHQLQLSLRRLLDGDEDGSLSPDELDGARDFGLEPGELQKRSIHASLAQLVQGCHRARLLPSSYTASIARREAWLAAEGEVEQMKRPVREEIEGMLKTWEIPDYSRLETWRRGAVRFLQWLHIPVFWLGRPRTLVVWLTSCVFISLMATSSFRRRKLAIALLLGCALSVPLTFPALKSLAFSLVHLDYFLRGRSWVGVGMYVSPGMGFLCLSMASAGYGARIGGGHRSHSFYFFSGALGLGITLLVWNVHRWVFGEAWWRGSELGDWFYEASIGGDWLFSSPIPNWVRSAAAAVGAVSLITGCLGFAHLRISPPRAGRPILTKESGQEEHQG